MQALEVIPTPIGGHALALLDRPPAPDRCPVTLYLNNDLTTAVGRRNMAYGLKRAARLLTVGQCDDPRLIDWSRVGNAYVARLRTLLIEQFAAPATVNYVLSAVKGVLRQVWRLGLIDTDEYHRAVDVKGARGSRVDRHGRCLAPLEVQALIDACKADEAPSGARDAAIFALAFGAGLRREELCTLRLSDYNPDDAECTGCLVVSGKGDKERLVYVKNGSRAALTAWIALRGSEEGQLFVPVSWGRKIDLAGRLSGQALSQIMTKRAKQAKVDGFSPHDCRRTYISGLLDCGIDISTVATLAGHASVNTTRIYDRRGERARIAAADTVPFPYEEGDNS